MKKVPSYFISKVYLEKIYGIFNSEITFFPDINIIYGDNGAGKTTLLHILANILDENFYNFNFIDFDLIRIEFNTEDFICIQKYNKKYSKESNIPISSNLLLLFNRKKILDINSSSKDYDIDSYQEYTYKYSNNRIKLLENFKSAYFPAFRNMIESWEIAKPKDYSTISDLRYFKRIKGDTLRDNRQILRKTEEFSEFAKLIYGKFTPDINYPSVIEIEKLLIKQIYQTYNLITREYDNLINITFINIFKALFSTEPKEEGSPDTILEKIKNYLELFDKSTFKVTRKMSIYDELKEILKKFKIKKTRVLPRNTSKILQIYEKFFHLSYQKINKLIKPLQNYIDAVNFFLRGKSLKIATLGEYEKPLYVEFQNGEIRGLNVLSSGEKQIASMIFVASEFTENCNIILIDEPEISLHIDWQQELIKKMTDQLGQKQIIVCTHIPEIASKHLNRFKTINFYQK